MLLKIHDLNVTLLSVHLMETMLPKDEPIMNLVKRYPLLIFFGLAFLFSGLWEVLALGYGAASPLLSVVTLLLAS